MKEIYIGNKLRSIRKEKGYNLEELAKLSGVQIATLSRIENNVMTGTVKSHLRLAYILGVDVTEFYTELEGFVHKPKIEVTRDTPEVITDGGSSYQILTDDTSSKRMLPSLITLSKNGKTPEEKQKTNSEIFIHVLEGSIEAKINKDTYQINKGSSMYFKGTQPHFFKNTSTTKSKILYLRS